MLISISLKALAEFSSAFMARVENRRMMGEVLFMCYQNNMKIPVRLENKIQKEKDCLKLCFTNTVRKLALNTLVTL